MGKCDYTPFSRPEFEGQLQFLVIWAHKQCKCKDIHARRKCMRHWLILVQLLNRASRQVNVAHERPPSTKMAHLFKELDPWLLPSSAHLRSPCRPIQNLRNKKENRQRNYCRCWTCVDPEYLSVFRVFGRPIISGDLNQWNQNNNMNCIQR